MASLLNDPDMRAAMGLPPMSSSTGVRWTGSTDIFGNKNGFGKEILPTGYYEEGKYNNNRKIGVWRTCYPDGYTTSTMTYDEQGNLLDVRNVAVPAYVMPAPAFGYGCQPQPFPITPGQPGQVYFQAPPGQ